MTHRLETIKMRFPAREGLNSSEFARTFYKNHDPAEIAELFALIEREFRVDVGFLRPDDSLHALFAPVPSRNPLLWGFFRLLESDGVKEISSQVARKRGERGLPAIPEGGIRTLGDLIKAWSEQPSRRVAQGG